MSTIRVFGDRYLKGIVKINGSKNAAMPLMCASLLVKGKVLLKNIPRISDVFDLVKILEKLGCDIKFKNHMMLIDNTNIKYQPLFMNECKKIRGSYYLIGVFLSLFGKCEILLPGGCEIGKRPIDLHLKAFEDLGYSYFIIDDKLFIDKKQNLSDVSIKLSKKSVGASLNVLFAGLSIEKFNVENVLFEPEGLDVIKFLQNAGYNVSLDNTNLSYEKRSLEFKLVKHVVIPDRIEVMTFIVLGLLCGDLTIQNVDIEHLKEPINLLKNSGYNIILNRSMVKVLKSLGGPLFFETDVYPGIPTDIQPILGVLALFNLGTSNIVENVFEKRFQIYEDMKIIGGNIKYDKGVIVDGGSNFSGGEFTVRDLRHGAALILLAMKLDGVSIIHNYDIIQRGYENIIGKINKIGGKIEFIQ